MKIGEIWEAIHDVTWINGSIAQGERVIIEDIDYFPIYNTADEEYKGVYRIYFTYLNRDEHNWLMSFIFLKQFKEVGS